VYVGVAARRGRAGRQGRDPARLDAVGRPRRLGAHARLKQPPVAPAIVIAFGSAGHLHAYWPLARPVNIRAAETANRRLAAQLGADGGAVTNAATILRPPGTYSFKTDPGDTCRARAPQ
jgi:hypothetical protein